MTIAVGVMGSAGDASDASGKEALAEKANALAQAIAAARKLMLLDWSHDGNSLPRGQGCA